MRISEVTNDDGKQCAQLINALRTGRWDLSGADAEVLVSVKKWVQAMAGQMAQQLRDSSQSKSPSSTEGFRIKSAGPLPAPSLPTPKKKKSK